MSKTVRGLIDDWANWYVQISAPLALPILIVMPFAWFFSYWDEFGYLLMAVVAMSLAVSTILLLRDRLER